MPYVSRGPDGKVTALFDGPREDAQEELPPSHPDVAQFLSAAGGTAQMAENPRQALAQSDLEMIRVIEDLIELLIEKGTILITDLPEGAQEKLMQRHKLRGIMSFMDVPVGEEDDIL